MAAALAVSQANISRIEHEDDVFLSTLRDYARALGGELRVQIVFPDGVVDVVPTDGAPEQVQ